MPPAPPKLTVPVGIEGVPLPVASDTLAVQVVCELTGTDVWSQLTATELALWTITNDAPAELGPWYKSPV